MFAGKLKYDEDGFPDTLNGESPRLNFDSLKEAFLSVFIILIGDNWNEIMYNCMRSTNEVTSSIYFIILLAFGKFVMLNLFLAILLGNFDSSRHFLYKQKKIEEIVKLTQHGISIGSSIEISLGRMGKVIVEKIYGRGYLEPVNGEVNLPDVEKLLLEGSISKVTNERKG